MCGLCEYVCGYMNVTYVGISFKLAAGQRCGTLTEGPGSPVSPGLPWKPCGPWNKTDESAGLVVGVRGGLQMTHIFLISDRF